MKPLKHSYRVRSGLQPNPIGARLQQLRDEAPDELRRREAGLAPRLAKVPGQHSAIEGPLVPGLRPGRRPGELGAERCLAAAGAADDEGAAGLGRRPLLQAVGELGERPLAAEEALLLDHRSGHRAGCAVGPLVSVRGRG